MQIQFFRARTRSSSRRPPRTRTPPITGDRERPSQCKTRPKDRRDATTTAKHLRDSHFRRFAVKPKLGPLHPVEEGRTYPREGCIRKLPLFGIHGVYMIVSLNGRQHYFSGGARVGGISNLKCHFTLLTEHCTEKSRR